MMKLIPKWYIKYRIQKIKERITFLEAKKTTLKTFLLGHHSQYEREEFVDAEAEYALLLHKLNYFESYI